MRRMAVISMAQSPESESSPNSVARRSLWSKDAASVDPQSSSWAPLFRSLCIVDASKRAFGVLVALTSSEKRIHFAGRWGRHEAWPLRSNNRETRCQSLSGVDTRGNVDGVNLPYVRAMDGVARSLGRS